MKYLIIIIFYIAIFGNNSFGQIAPAGGSEDQEQSEDSSDSEGSDKAGSAGSPKSDTDANAFGVNQAVQNDTIMEIKRLDTEASSYLFELKNADLTDLFRALAHDYKLNLVVDNDIQGKITATFNNISLEDALNEIAVSQNLVLEKRDNIIRIKSNLQTRIFLLKYVEAKKLLEGNSSATGGSGASGSSEQGGSAGGGGSGGGAGGGTTTEAGGGGSAGGSGGASASGGSSGTSSGGAGGGNSQSSGGEGGAGSKQANTIFDLLSDKGKILLGNIQNSLIVIDYPKNIEQIEGYIKVIDQKMTRRTFKIKYLKASEVVGAASFTAAAGSGSSSAAAGSSQGSGGTGGGQ